MPKVKGSLAAASAKGDDARDAEDVGDLVRVGRHRGRAVGQHRADELVDPELGRLEVHVGVDETGRERRAGHVDGLARLAAGPSRRWCRPRWRGRSSPTRVSPARRRCRH